MSPGPCGDFLLPRLLRCCWLPRWNNASNGNPSYQTHSEDSLGGPMLRSIILSHQRRPVPMAELGPGLRREDKGGIPLNYLNASKRPTENEFIDFSRLWHDGCVKAIIEAQDVDRNHSAKLSARGTALRKRCHGCGMGADRAPYAGGQAFGPAARHRVASRAGRDLVHRADRLSVADAAQGLSPVHHGARLFLRLARQRPV